MSFGARGQSKCGQGRNGCTHKGIGTSWMIDGTISSSIHRCCSGGIHQGHQGWGRDWRCGRRNIQWRNLTIPEMSRLIPTSSSNVWLEDIAVGFLKVFCRQHGVMVVVIAKWRCRVVSSLMLHTTVGRRRRRVGSFRKIARTGSNTRCGGSTISTTVIIVPSPSCLGTRNGIVRVARFDEMD
jgi:hypothetical protein